MTTTELLSYSRGVLWDEVTFWGHVQQYDLNISLLFWQAWSHAQPVFFVHCFICLLLKYVVVCRQMHSQVQSWSSMVDHSRLYIIFLTITVDWQSIALQMLWLLLSITVLVVIYNFLAKLRNKAIDELPLYNRKLHAASPSILVFLLLMVKHFFVCVGA